MNYHFLLTPQYVLNKYGKDEFAIRYSYYKKFSSFLNNEKIKKLIDDRTYNKVINNIENMILNWNNIKKCGSNNKTKWLLFGFSNDDASKIINSCVTSKEAFIFRQGKDDGEKRYDEWKKKVKNNRPKQKEESTHFCKKYWIERGLSEEESILKVKESNTRNLDYFVKKYGEDFGTEKYNNMIKKRKISFKKENYIKRHGIEGWNKLLKSRRIDVEHFVEKYGEDLGKEKYEQHVKNRLRQSLKSKPAIKIENFLKDLGYNVESEVMINKRMFDMVCNNFLIEINGDWWHMNPFLYEATSFNSNLERIAEEVWSDDWNKIESVLKLNHNVLVIWELGIRKNFSKLCSFISNFNFSENLSGEFISINFDGDNLTERRININEISKAKN